MEGIMTLKIVRIRLTACYNFYRNMHHHVDCMISRSIIANFPCWVDVYAIHSDCSRPLYDLAGGASCPAHTIHFAGWYL
jgi:hypothetical protein